MKLSSKAGRWIVGVLWLACWHPVFGHGEKVEGDGKGYYVYARALVVRGSFRLDPRDAEPTEKRSSYIQDYYLDLGKANGGRIGTQYPAGCSLLWLPGVFSVHLALTAGHAAGISDLPPADGFSKPYRLAAAVTTVLLGLAGLLACFELASGLVGVVPALVGVAAGLFATPLYNYLSYETSMSEGPSFALVAIACWLGVRASAGAGVLLWGAWGLTLGLATDVRFTQGVLLVWPVAEFLLGKSARRRGRWPRLRATVMGSAIPLLIQLLIWRASTGAWAPPHYATGIDDFGRLDPVPVLWSARHGLFASHPAWYLGLAGCLLLLVRGPMFVRVLIGFFVWLVWVNQLPFDFWAGHSFGARRFVPAVPLVIVGTAVVAARMIRRWKQRGLIAVTGIVILLSALSVEALVDYRFLGQARGLPSPQGARVMPAGLYRLVGWPGCWPANLLWAWRWRVSPASYDLGASLQADNPPDFGHLPDSVPYVVDFSAPGAAGLISGGAVEWAQGGVRLPDGTASVWLNFRHRLGPASRWRIISSDGRIEMKSPWRPVPSELASAPGHNLIRLGELKQSAVLKRIEIEP